MRAVIYCSHMAKAKITMSDVLEAVQVFSATMDKDFKAVKKDIKDIKTEIVGIKTEIGGIKGEIVGIKGEIVEIKNDIASILGRLDAIEKDIEALKVDLKELKQKDQEDSDALGQNYFKLERRIVFLEKEVRQLRAVKQRA